MKIVSVLIAVLFTVGLFLSVPASISIAQEEGTEIELQDEEQGSEYDREIEELRQEDLEEDLQEEESGYDREIEELQQEEEGEENAPEEEEQNYPDEKYQEDRG
jgi:preprotein translocase subunit SecF